MKITFMLAANDFSGGCQVIVKIALLLQQRGHEVRLLCPKRTWRSPRVIIRDFLKKGELRLKDPQRGYADQLGQSLVYLRPQTPVRSTDVPEADVIIATWFETAHWVAALPARAGGKLYFMQDYGAPNMPFERLVPTWRYPFVFVTLTNALAGMIRSENERAEIFVMKNAVSSSASQPLRRTRPKQPKIGFAYRSLSSKGMDLALAALKIAKDARPNLTVVCFGRQKPESLPSFVEFAADPSDKERDEIYASCTAWLFPSLLEGFGLPIIEAMAVGTPVIATKAGAGPDIVVTSHNGILLDSFGPEEMAEAIIAMADQDDEHWARLSARAVESVSNYTWDDAVDIFETACFSAASTRSNEVMTGKGAG
ncbi:glycosyltransferase family 4 protein [Erythrobacter sp. sf7]|uniref:Glycosyltransferase family 4 protein n=1 Tax=Erythrobacter fulvus TaxID=2987523 RepID=A0ABT5JRX9_9SPHN|nr:glycosyltransferase family 4 protein [Erythrobacter fulvus]MDC8754841.1 glycosyltransferase family 4 protein [Erythrobacter fulvus]